MGLEFVAKLVDEISEPAKKAGLSVDGLKKHLEEAGGGLKLAAVGVGVAAVGIIALGASLYEGARAAIEARENIEKMSVSLEALSGGRNSGDEIIDMLREVGHEVPQSEAQINDWAHSLMAAGQTDMGALREELKAVAGAEALVQGGGDKISTMLAKLHEQSVEGTKIKFSMAGLKGTGITEAELTEALGMTPKQIEMAKKHGTLSADAMSKALTEVLVKKSAPALESSMHEVGTIMTKAKDNISRLFEDVDLTPFTKGLGMVADLFDQSKASGRTFALFVHTAFNALFAIVGKVFPYIRWGMLQLAILGLKAYIALVPLVAKFKEFWAQHSLGDKLMVVVRAVGIVIAVVAIIIGVAVVAATALAGGLLVLAGVIVTALSNALHWLFGFVGKAQLALWNWTESAEGAAKNFIMGLVNGIKSGVSVVLDSVKELGAKMLGGIKGVLGIASPSIEMSKIGVNMGAGLEQGIDRGSPGPQAAAERLAQPPAPSTSTTSHRSSSSATFAPVIHVSGGGESSAIAEAVRASMADLFDQFALSQGG